MLKDYFRFAWGALTHKKLRSWLTLLGIFIGVAAVVSLISLGDGLQNAVSSQFGISATEVITIQAGGLSGFGPPGTGVVNPLTQDDVDAIAAIPSVDRSIARIIETVDFKFNDKITFSWVGNVPKGDDGQFVIDSLDVNLERGRWLRDSDSKSVILGYNFWADKVGLDKAIKVGDIVTIKDEHYEVVGLLERKGSFIIDSIILMPNDAVTALLDDPDRVDIIAVQIKDKDLMDSAAESITRVMRKQRDVKVGEEDFEVQTPEAALSTVNGILAGVQAFVVLIASVSILVGALGIVNTMTTSVLERKKQIGVMKAIGAKNSDIFFQFFIESGLMGLMGGIIGATIGAAIGYFGTVALNAWVNSQAPPQINIPLIIGALVGSFLIGAVSGIVPALQAARQEPVDALRE